MHKVGRTITKDLVVEDREDVSVSKTLLVRQKSRKVARSDFEEEVVTIFEITVLLNCMSIAVVSLMRKANEGEVFVLVVVSIVRQV